jgi:tRNA 5-methylaminomethyl-2-thiouridine biosynthesis bifunctional protein
MNLYQPIEPAILDWQDGVPYSARFGDVYHSRAGGVAQSEHVFLSGCRIRERWSELAANTLLPHLPFVVLEFGFGLGINFLTTLNAWLNRPLSPDDQTTLHYVGFEKHPLSAEDLAKVLRPFAEFDQSVGLLLSCWPAPTPGMHRVVLDDQKFILDLWFGDAAESLSQWQGHADAVYLDGFSPKKNEALWTESLFRLLAKRMRGDALLATYSVALSVRRGLEAASFLVEKRPGFANKRDMLVARQYVHPAQPKQKPSLIPDKPAKILVVGAGIAGVWVSNALARAGHAVELIDESDTIAAKASGNPVGAFHPHLSIDDNRLSQLSRQGCEATLYSLQRLTHKGLLRPGIDWALLGHLQLADSVEDQAQCIKVVEHLNFPPTFLRWLGNQQTEQVCGLRSRYGGFWFSQAGWINPRRWLDAALAEVAGKVQLHLGRKVAKVFSSFDADSVTGILLEDGDFMHADRVVIASAEQSLSLLALPTNLTSIVKGQVSVLRGHHPLPKCVISGSSYGIPLPRGRLLIGATYERPAHDLSVTETAHQQNLYRWANAFPDTRSCEIEFGRSALRSVWPDRLPAVGNAMNINGDCLPDIFFATGYASRGLTWAVLAADVIAAQLTHLPSPLPKHLQASIDPKRFALRWFKKK